MMSCGRKADFLGQDPIRAAADFDLALEGVGLALLVEGHHDHGRAVAADQLRAGRMNFSSPSLRLIELTMPLPCMHFSPASMTDHFELSIMTGTRAMSGSAAIRFRKSSIAASESSIPSSMLTSMICAPPSTCCRATLSAFFVFAGQNQLGETSASR